MAPYRLACDEVRSKPPSHRAARPTSTDSAEDRSTVSTNARVGPDDRTSLRSFMPWATARVVTVHPAGLARAGPAELPTVTRAEPRNANTPRMPCRRRIDTSPPRFRPVQSEAGPRATARGPSPVSHCASAIPLRQGLEMQFVPKTDTAFGPPAEGVGTKVPARVHGCLGGRRFRYRTRVAALRGRDNPFMADGMEQRLDEVEARYEDLQRQLSAPDVASDPDRLRRLGKDFAELGEIVVPWREYRAALAASEEARSMAKAEEDADMSAYFRDEAETAGARAAKLRKKLEELLVPKDPNDGKDVVLEIRAGPGGQEAMLWAGDLYELYRRYAERRRYKTEVLSASPSDLGGFKEVVVEVRGKGAFSRLKHESGTHRVQRVPVTESSGRIHTSTATVAVLPEAEDVEVEIRPEDLQIDLYRSSGPGGQSVNTTDSAVRITHKPTGIVVGSQEERSQLQNREKAMRYLRARLFQKALEEQQAAEAAVRKQQVGTGERAEKIRTYNFPDNRVTDHRVKVTSHQMQNVMDGDIDGFVDALLAAERAAQLAGDGSDSRDGSSNSDE